MKDTYYFPHDYGARRDPKVIALIQEFGMEGYGIYWVLIEMMYEQGGKIKKFPQLLSALAFEFRSKNEAQLKQIEAVLDLLRLLQLIEENEDFIWSASVLRRIEERSAKLKTKVEAGRLGGAKSAEKRRQKSEHKIKSFQANEALLQANEAKEKKRKEIYKLPKGNSGETEFFKKNSENENAEKNEYGNPRVNRMLEFLKNRIGIEDFRENQKLQRNYAYLLAGIEDDKGEDEFRMQVNAILNDEFRAKNANSIAYIYREMKSSRQEQAETSDLTAEELKAKIEKALDFPKNDEQNQKRMEEQTKRAAEELKKIGIIP